MKALMHHVYRVREHPHHLRKKASFVVAAGGTGLIALVWLTANLSSGAFALQNASFADATQSGGVTATPADTLGGATGVAGVAAAANAAADTPRIQIIDTTASSTVKTPKVEPTIIPF